MNTAPDQSTFLSPPVTLNAESWPPDYRSIFQWRQQQLLFIRSDPKNLRNAMEYYRTHPVEFINHWMLTFDPRNAAEDDKLTKMPFITFERQAELVDFIFAMINGKESGLIEKCRDMGATWICCAVSVWLWIFRPGAAIGWGSRKQELVDRIGDPKTIFDKLRMLIDYLPAEFLPVEFVRKDHMTFMKIINPANGASISGEGGDNIGRGGRTLAYFVDEAAHLEHPMLVEAALGDNTNTQIDISSVNGIGNVFHNKRKSGELWTGGAAYKNKTNVFIMDWSDHPEKTKEWYDNRKERQTNNGTAHLFAQEVDRDYAASVEGILIAPEWIAAAVDAHLKIEGDWISEKWGAALDVADEGPDKNALAAKCGVILRYIETWGERDTGVTARRAVAACKGLGDIQLDYDCIGVGAGVKSETNRLKDEKLMPEGIRLMPWNAGGSVQNPKDNIIPEDEDTPLNKDHYLNLKAQAGWELRFRFYRTWQAVTQGIAHPIDSLISLDSTLPLLRDIEMELSQPTSGQSASLKTMIDKKPDGSKSPNLYDAIAMVYFPMQDDPGFEYYIGG